MRHAEDRHVEGHRRALPHLAGRVEDDVVDVDQGARRDHRAAELQVLEEKEPGSLGEDEHVGLVERSILQPRRRIHHARAVDRDRVRALRRGKQPQRESKSR